MSAGAGECGAGGYHAVTACEKLSEPFAVDEAALARSFFIFSMQVSPEEEKK